MKTAAAAALALLFTATVSVGQTVGAKLKTQKKPDFPEAASKGLQQGNVVLIGRIDKQGKLQDLRAVASTLPEFLEPALAAAKTWEFAPATRDGKPVDVAANVAIRFRLTSNIRGQIARPILGDLSVSPADASGKPTAPEGFPIRRGSDAKLRVEAILDVSPEDKAKQPKVVAEAVSPGGKRTKVFERGVALKPKHPEIKVSFSPPVGADWEDGIWRIAFTVDGADAGSGQFWLAGDPARFDFTKALRALK
jgi:TonB family protein